MTPSIDPNNNHTLNSQLDGTFNWASLINRHQFGIQSRNPIQSSLHFLNCFISHESLYGDSEGAKEMIKVMMILQSIDAPASEMQEAKINRSYEYVCAYRDLLFEVSAPTDVCFQFERLAEVLAILVQMRQQSKLGVLCSYGQLNQCLMCRG